jgi:hypothetical protein
MCSTMRRLRRRSMYRWQWVDAFKEPPAPTRGDKFDTFMMQTAIGRTLLTMINWILRRES